MQDSHAPADPPTQCPGCAAALADSGYQIGWVNYTLGNYWRCDHCGHMWTTSGPYNPYRAPAAPSASSSVSPDIRRKSVTDDV